MMKNKSTKMRKTSKQNMTKKRHWRNIVVLPVKREEERMENRKFSVEKEGGSRMNVKKRMREKY